MKNHCDNLAIFNIFLLRSKEKQICFNGNTFLLFLLQPVTMMERIPYLNFVKVCTAFYFLICLARIIVVTAIPNLLSTREFQKRQWLS